MTQSLPSELVDIIIGYYLEKNAKIIQWNFRQQSKLEDVFFQILNNPVAPTQEVLFSFKLKNRLHLNNPYVKFRTEYLMLSQINRIELLS